MYKERCDICCNVNAVYVALILIDERIQKSLTQLF